MRFLKSYSIYLLAVVLTWSVVALPLPAGAYTPKEIYQKAGTGVVFILASDASLKGRVGTGAIIRSDGLVITNAHVVTEPGTSRLKTDIAIYLKPKVISGDSKRDLSQRYRGEVIAYDVALDLALLRIKQADRPLTVIPFGDSTAVAIGDPVYAIGHPEQGGLWSLTTGVVSAFFQNYGGVPGKNLFQTDASINRGNSGGPLLNSDGEMIGINSLIARQAPDGLTITAVNFSIMAQVANRWLSRQGYPVQIQTAAVHKAPLEVQAPARSPEPAAPQKKPVPAPAPAPEAKEEAPIQKVIPEEKPLTEAIPEKAPAPEVIPEKKTLEEVIPEKAPEPEPFREKLPPFVEPPEENSVSEPKPLIAEPSEEKPAGPEERILTPPRPYNMDTLLKDMQEMEDLMDEMRDTIKHAKEKRF